MTTVKEFKDLGGELVVGDKRSSSTYRHGDVKMTDALADGSNSSNGTDHEVIKSFAWRPLNTLPDNPKFKYEVGFDNHGWRPLLDQSSAKPSDDKPVFTQEMAGRGELPPVGSDFLHAKRVVTCLSVSDYDGGVVTFAYKDRDSHEPDIACCWNNETWVKPIDTRTPKQKAVDELEEHLNDIQCIRSSTQRNAVAVILVNLGYKKC